MFLGALERLVEKAIVQPTDIQCDICFPRSYDAFYNVGLDHIALVCENEAELQRVATALADAGVENTGVKTDPTLNKNYVAFKDPDRIQWEFYMA